MRYEKMFHSNFGFVAFYAFISIPNIINSLNIINVPNIPSVINYIDAIIRNGFTIHRLDINLILMVIFVLINCIIKFLPKYEINNIIKPNKNIIRIYEINFVISIFFFVFLLLQIVSFGFFSKPYCEEMFIFSIGMILMTYSSNTEDIIYLIHKIKLRSDNPTLYFLLGSKMNKLFSNNILNNLKSHQSILIQMEILAVHSTFNRNEQDRDEQDNYLNEFYKNLLEYCVEKNYHAGHKSLKTLNRMIDNIYFQNQKETEFDFNKIKKIKKTWIYRTHIITNHILDISMYRTFIIILSILSISHTIYWGID